MEIVVMGVPQWGHGEGGKEEGTGEIATKVIKITRKHPVLFFGIGGEDTSAGGPTGVAVHCTGAHTSCTGGSRS